MRVRTHRLTCKVADDNRKYRGLEAKTHVSAHVYTHVYTHKVTDENKKYHELEDKLKIDKTAKEAKVHKYYAAIHMHIPVWPCLHGL